MSTVPHKEQPVAFLRIRVTRRLEQRVKIEAVKRSTSVQTICTEALEKYFEGLRPKKSEAA